MATSSVELLLAQLFDRAENSSFIYNNNSVCTAGMGIFQSVVFVSGHGSVLSILRDLANHSAVCIAFLKQHMGEFIIRKLLRVWELCVFASRNQICLEH